MPAELCEVSISQFYCETAEVGSARGSNLQWNHLLILQGVTLRDQPAMALHGAGVVPDVQRLDRVRGPFSDS